MLIRILNTATTEQMGYGIISFFCVLAPHEMNSIVFGQDKGEKSEVFYLLERYICQGILFICSHITFVMVCHFYFLCFDSTWNEIVFGKIKGEKSEVFYLLERYIATTFFYILFCKSMSTNITPILF